MFAISIVLSIWFPGIADVAALIGMLVFIFIVSFKGDST
jgi:hypothetical protein